MAADGQIIINTAINTSDVNAGVADIQNRVEKLADKMKSVGETMSKAVTVPMVAAGGAAMKFADDVNASTGRIQAGLGVTEEEARKLTGVAQEVFVNGWGESLGEVSDKLAIVKNNMGDLNDADLSKVTQGAYFLAERFDADVNESTRAAGQLMKDFGVDSTKAMDMLTWGFQNGLDYTGEFLDTVREYSPQFTEMGYTGEQMLNTLKSGFDAGAWSLDKIGDSIKESHLRMGALDKATVEAYKSMGLNAEEYVGKIAKGGKEGNKAFQEIVKKLMEVDDATLRNQLSTDLFGTQFEDLREKVIFSMAGASKSIEGLEGTTQKAADALQDNFGDRFKKAFRELQTTLVPLGNILLDMAESVLPIVSSAIQTVAKWFESLSPVGQQVTVVIGMIVAAIGPFLTVVGMMIGPITNVIGVLSKLGPMFTVVRTAMMALTGPVGIISAIVVALAVLIYKNWDDISKWTVKAWGHIKNFLANVWDGIKLIYETSVKAMKDFISKAWDWIKDTTSKVWNSIKNFFKNHWDEILAIFTGPIGMLVYMIAHNWDTIKNKTKEIWDAVKNKVQSSWQAIKDKTTEIMNAVKSKVQEVWNAIKTFIQDKAQAIWQAVQDRFNRLKDVVRESLNKVRDVAKTVWGYVQDFFEGINLERIGRNIIQGLINGLWGKFDSLMSTARSIANSIASKIQNALDIHSPSRVAIKLGAYFTEGLEGGLLERAKQLMKAATQIGETVAIGTRKPLESARLDISNQKLHAAQTASNPVSSVGDRVIQLVMPNVRTERDARGISVKLHDLESRSYRVGGVN